MKKLLLAVLLVGTLVVSGVAFGAAGAVNDGDDNEGGLDFQQVRHADTSSQVEYQADFWDADPYTHDGGMDPNGENHVLWRIDFKQTGDFDMIVYCNVDNRAAVDCDILRKDAKIGEASGSWADNNTLRVTYNRSIFSQVPESAGQSRYFYDVKSKWNGRDPRGFFLDWVPDAGEITHSLSGTGGASASPSATPCPTPTATPGGGLPTLPPLPVSGGAQADQAATPCPTPAPTASPVPTPTPTGGASPSPSPAPGPLDPILDLLGVSGGGGAAAASAGQPGIAGADGAPGADGEVIDGTAAADDDAFSGLVTAIVVAFGAVALGQLLIGLHRRTQRSNTST